MAAGSHRQDLCKDAVRCYTLKCGWFIGRVVARCHNHMVASCHSSPSLQNTLHRVTRSVQAYRDAGQITALTYCCVIATLEKGQVDCFKMWKHSSSSMSFVCHYAAVTSAQVCIGKAPCFKWGPFTLLALGCTLVMLDVLRYLILDNRVLANPEVLAMYMGNRLFVTCGQTCKLLSTTGTSFIGFSMARLLGRTDKIYAKMQ